MISTVRFLARLAGLLAAAVATLAIATTTLGLRATEASPVAARGAAGSCHPAGGDQSSTMSYCSGFIVGSALSEIGLPMKADKSAR